MDKNNNKVREHEQHFSGSRQEQTSLPSHLALKFRFL